MKKELENLLTKIEWEGDYLYVLENFDELIPEDDELKKQMANLRLALKDFKTRLSALCIEHKLDPDEYDY